MSRAATKRRVDNAVALEEEAADRARLMLFVVSRLRMGTPPNDIDVAARDVETVILRHEGRQYQVVLARTSKERS